MKKMMMLLLAVLLISATQVTTAQDAGDFKPATTNVWGAEYPRVDSQGRVAPRDQADVGRAGGVDADAVLQNNRQISGGRYIGNAVRIGIVRRCAGDSAWGHGGNAAFVSS